MNKLSDSDGQALIITAFSMTLLLGFAALAIDTGALFRAKRQMQTAADAAAVAGAMDYLYTLSGTSAATAAKSASSNNGFTDGANGVTVTVNHPPASGPNAGGANFVEVIVQKPVHTLFMSLNSFFRSASGISSITMGARAVAGMPNAGQTCIWLMSTSGTALSLQGSYDLELPGCGVYVNSPASNALSITGNGGTVNAKFLNVVGSSTSNHATNPTAPTLNAPPQTNPFGDLTGPTNTSQCTSVVTTSGLTLSGSIAGPGAGNTVCYTQAVTLSGATLGTGTTTTNATTGKQTMTTTSPAGTFVFMNGVTISGTVNVYGGTIDIEGGTFNQNSSSTLSITAPTSGVYNAIAIMQPSVNNHALQVQFGSSNQVLDGWIYAPNAALTLHDSGGGSTTSGVVALSMANQTSGVTIPSYDAAHPTTTPNRIITLVE